VLYYVNDILVGTSSLEYYYEYFGFLAGRNIIALADYIKFYTFDVE